MQPVNAPSVGNPGDLIVARLHVGFSDLFPPPPNIVAATSVPVLLSTLVPDGIIERLLVRETAI